MNTLAFINFLLVKIFHRQKFVPYGIKIMGYPVHFMQNVNFVGVALFVFFLLYHIVQKFQGTKLSRFSLEPQMFSHKFQSVLALRDS